jgi:hypothetical protein
MDWGLQPKLTPLNTAAIQTKVLICLRAWKEKQRANRNVYCKCWLVWSIVNRVHLHNVKFNGEAASANEDAASKYPDV